MSRETSDIVTAICGLLAVAGIIAIRIDMHRLRRWSKPDTQLVRIKEERGQ